MQHGEKGPDNHRDNVFSIVNGNLPGGWAVLPDDVVSKLTAITEHSKKPWDPFILLNIVLSFKHK